METQSILLLITLVIIIISSREYILDKILSLRKTNQYEKYATNEKSNKLELPVVLNEYNSSLSKQTITKISKNTSYGKGTFTHKIREEVMPIINNVLNSINKLGNNRLKFMELDRIEKLEDAHNNRQYFVGLFVHSVDASVTNKLILNYYVNSTDVVHINSLKQQSKTEIHKNNRDIMAQLQSTDSNSNLWRCIDRDMIKQSGAIIDEPCKFTLNMWGKDGAHKELQLRKKCKIVNNSQMIKSKTPYVNPTLFSPMFESPLIQYTK